MKLLSHKTNTTQTIGALDAFDTIDEILAIRAIRTVFEMRRPMTTNATINAIAMGTIDTLSRVCA